MTVEYARLVIRFIGLQRWDLSLENRNIRRDLLVAEAHRTDWRTRQQVIWADGLHRTLMAGVAW